MKGKYSNKENRRVKNEYEKGERELTRNMRTRTNDGAKRNDKEQCTKNE